MKDALEQVYEVIDEVTNPKAMSKEDYKEFLEELQTNIQGRLEAVSEELGED